MQSKVIPNKPFLMLLYGYPGSGKTTFAKQFANEMPAVHLQAEKFQHELHEATHGQAAGSSAILLHYMTKEFLKAGVSVILDAPVSQRSERKMFRSLATKSKASLVLVWLQIDADTAFARTQKRDRRKTEDKYAQEYSQTDFQNIISESQNPKNEDYVVISGKHTFHTQRGSVMKKLYELGILTQEDANSRVVKPGLVNLISQASPPNRNDFPRRNITIR